MGDSTLQANKHCAHDDPLVASSDHVIVGVEIHYRQNDICVLGITIVDHDSSMNVFECIHVVNQTVSVVVTACRSVDATPKKLSTPRSACGDEYRVRAYDASEFRSVVQQLTGNDSNSNKKVERPHKGYSSTLMHQRVMQSHEDAHGIGLYHYNRSTTTSLELDEDYYWKELARSVLP
ncbi:hypothetical protein JHK82_054613 [Glycine max]|uniref:VQ domain-containing protein n=1 Tax=Glycine soja TaxID=3848 RepID=A0A445FL60_GLYSO|nr:hypothetical protein JHK82_054609 [Glycine max]KAG5087216.1 hypothetical protein JHK82_054613 [Glycine max]RZB49596.1 hypothetical protein D0Y65_052492 [Glycine soja]